MGGKRLLFLGFECICSFFFILFVGSLGLVLGLVGFRGIGGWGVFFYLG